MNASQSRFFKMKNVNPWHKNIDDCAIRALSPALGIKYQALCDILGRKCRPGFGLVGSDKGISLELIKRVFNKFFDKLEDARDLRWENRPEEFAGLEFDPAFDENPDLGFTLDEFCEAYAGTGRYLVAVVLPPHSNLKLPNGLSGHIVYVNLNPNKGYFIDTWDCGQMIVKAYMRVKHVLSAHDPRSVLNK